MNLLRFDREKLREMRDLGEKNLFFFARAIWGHQDVDPDFHGDLCSLLQEEDWRRLVICAFRGSLKSSVVEAWMAWTGLYRVNYSFLLVEQRADNAKRHHNLLQQKFRMSALLQDMYRDRIPDGFAGWNSEQTVFNRTDPNADVFLRHVGLDSKLESMHVDCIVGDDLEGADAEKSDAPNEDSADFVFTRAEPLLKSPSESRVVIVGTPHGKRPLVWELKDLAETAEPHNGDGPDLNWRIWWKPIIDASGEMAWKHPKFTVQWWNTRRRQAEKLPKIRKLLDMQYLLRRSSVADSVFDLETISGNYFSLRGMMIRYPAMTFHPELGEPTGEVEHRHIDLRWCHTFLHIDPAHKGQGEHADRVRPSESAIVAVAVSPDFHEFVVETWNAEAGLPAVAEQFIRMYVRWAPLKWTIETVGAQVWFLDYLRQMEKTVWRRLVSTSMPGRERRVLPRPSTRYHEMPAKTAAKELFIMEQLSTHHAAGFLHLHESQTALIDQHRLFPSEDHPMDLIDALAQGPAVWRPPLDPTFAKQLRSRMQMLEYYRTVEPVTGYVRPWGGAEALGALDQRLARAQKSRDERLARAWDAADPAAN